MNQNTHIGGVRLGEIQLRTPQGEAKTNPTRQALMDRAAAIVAQVRQQDGSITLSALGQIGIEYLDLERAMTTLPTIGNPQQTLWEEHCWAHDLGKHHGFFDLKK